MNYIIIGTAQDENSSTIADYVRVLILLIRSSLRKG